MDNTQYGGFLGGLFGGINQYQQEENMKAKILQQTLANERYAGETPNELLKSNLEGIMAQRKAQSDAYQQGVLNQTIGQGKSTLAAGKTAEETQASNSKLQVQKNLQEMDDMKYQTMLNGFDDAIMQMTQSSNPQATAQTLMQKYNIDPNSNFGKAMLGDNALAVLSGLKQNIMNLRKNTIPFMQKKELAKDAQDARVEAANIAANARIREAEEKAQGAQQKLELQYQLQKAMEIVANPQGYQPDVVEHAKRIIHESRINSLAKNPGAYKEGVNLRDFGIQTSPAPINQVPAGGMAQKPQLPAGWSVK